MSVSDLKCPVLDLGYSTHWVPGFESTDETQALRQYSDRYDGQVQEIIPHVAPTSTSQTTRDSFGKGSICNGLCQQTRALDDLAVTTSVRSLDGTPFQQIERLYEDDSLRAVFPVPRETLKEGSGDLPVRRNSKAKTSQREALPAASMENMMVVRKAVSTTCTLEWQRKIKRLSSYIGKIDWKLNSTNTATGKRAFTTNWVVNFDWEPEEVKGFNYSQSWLGENLNALCGDRWIINACQLLLARKLGIIERLPKLPLDELDDRNKGDLAVKIFAMSQIGWLFVQVMIRLVNGTPIAQLEVMATAFAACFLLTYCLLLDRPQDAQAACTVSASSHPSPEEMLRIANSGPHTWGGSQKYPWIPNNAIH